MSALALEDGPVADGAPRTGARLAGALLLAAALAAAGWSLVELLRGPALFPVRTVRFTGELGRVGEPRLRSAVDPLLGHGLMALDLSRLRGAVEALPWVSGASVRRVWPGTILIDVTEQRAVARWGDGALLNGDGEPFRPEHGPRGLPELAGPAGTEREVLARFLALRDRLAPADLTLVGLELDARRSWQARLAGGARLALGRRDVEARVARFAAAWPRLQAGSGERPLQSADLRYPNGFAVRWRAADESLEESL